MRALSLFTTLAALAFGGRFGADEPTTVEGYIKRGDEHLAKYAYSSAIADYTKAIELAPKSPEGYKRRAIAYNRNGKHDEAIADYTKAINADPADSLTYRDRGEVHRSTGKTELAIKDYTEAIELNPRDSHAYYLRSWAFDSQHLYQKSIADCDKHIELERATPRSYTHRADLLIRQKQYKTAALDFTKIIELEPNTAWNYIRRAYVYCRSEEWGKAVNDYTTAIKMEPKHFDWYEERARAYLGDARLDDAISDCDSAIGIYADSSRSYLLRAEAYRLKSKMDLATADFNRAIKNHPRDAGRLYLYQRRILPSILEYNPRELAEQATTAINKNPKDADAYVLRAAMSWGEKAIEDYTTALKLAPDQAAALHVCRGAAYQDRRRYASAVADYREALQLQPKMKLGEILLNSAIAEMTNYKSKTTVESVQLDEEVFFVKTSVEKDTLPPGATKTIKKTLTTRHEVTVADVRRMDVEVRASLKQKQESSSGSSSSSKSSDSTTVDGGGSLGVGIFSFGAGGGKGWESANESGYTSNTLTGWESEFGSSIRTGMEKSRALTSSTETSDEVSISPVGKGKDQPFLVIYRDKYRSGTAKLKINGVIDEVKFAFPVGKDITWEYVEKPKPEEKK